MIPVVSPFIPDIKRYNRRVHRVLSSKWLTNNGPMVRQLEEDLCQFLDVPNVVCVANGTVALQVIFMALGLKEAAITTPFTFCATSTSLLSQNIDPKYVDVDSRSFNLDKQKLTSLEDGVSVVATHVYGNPCDITLADVKRRGSRNVNLIFDAAHAFGVNVDNKSVLVNGTASALSFHATKIFHTIEGGAVVTTDDDLASEIRSLINFGLDQGVPTPSGGINGKMSEVHAAMGLCNLEHWEEIEEKRRIIWGQYRSGLNGYVRFQAWPEGSTNNCSYAPILLRDELQVKAVQAALTSCGIESRRYFWPSLDEVGYSSLNVSCPVSRNLSNQILCLPIYPDLSSLDVAKIIEVVAGIIDAGK